MLVALVVTAVATVFLYLVTLTLMREVVLLRGEVDSISTLIKNPPPPSFVGELAPAGLRDLIRQSSPDQHDGLQIVAFVRSGCGPCQSLVGGLSSAIESGRLDPQRLLFVVQTNGGPESRRFAASLPAYGVSDLDGSYARLCEVRGTPSLFAVDRSTGMVIAFNAGGDPEWVTSRLTEPLVPTTA